MIFYQTNTIPEIEMKTFKEFKEFLKGENINDISNLFKHLEYCDTVQINLEDKTWKEIKPNFKSSASVLVELNPDANPFAGMEKKGVFEKREIRSKRLIKL